MFTALLKLAKKSPVDSIEAVIADWFTFIRITGLCCTEYAQKMQSTFNEHEYPRAKVSSKLSSLPIGNSTIAVALSFTFTH